MGYNNTMLFPIWKSIEMFFNMMLYKGTKKETFMVQIMDRRSLAGFDLVRFKNDVTLRKSTTSLSVLDSRTSF